MYKLLLSLLFVGGSMQAAQFIVVDKQGAHPVNPAYVDKLVRDIDVQKIIAAQGELSFLPVRMDNGEYAVHVHVRGLGGGPATGIAAYWTTKVVGWGAMAVLIAHDPLLIAEAPHMLHAIETAAFVAQGLGTLAPTP